MAGKKFVMLFLALMIALSAASAFSIESGNDVSICAGTTSTIIDIISGEGSYSITSSGSAADFSTTIPSGLIVRSQDAVYSYISPQSTALPGDYELNVNIKNEKGEVKTANHKIKINDCHASVLSVDQDKTSCSCEEAVFLLTLKNSGGYLESYNIFAEGPAKKWVTLSDSIAIIGPGEEKAIKAYVKAPCDVYGKYELTFKAKSSTSLSVSTAKTNLDIKPCYEYSLETQKSFYSLCENDRLNIPLKISNLGTADNNYKLSINAPGWISLEKNQIAVNSMQNSESNLVVNPPYLTEGNFTISIEAVSGIGDVKKSLSAAVNVEKCYNVLVDIDSEKDRLCNAVSNKYEVRIKNTGKFNNIYDLSVDSDFATLSEKRVELKIDEEKTVSLDIHPSYDTPAKAYDITVKAIDSVSKASSSDAIKIEVATLEQCYQPSIKAKVENLELSKDSTATDLIIIENKGSDSATYILDLSGTASKFSELNPGIVTIAPGKAEAVYLYIAPNLLVGAGNYEAIVTARMKDTTILSSRTIGIKVNEANEIKAEVKEEIAEENITIENKTNFLAKIGQGFSRLGNGIGSAGKWAGNAVITAGAGIKGFFSNLVSSLRPQEVPLPENLTISELKEGFLAGNISTNQLRTYFTGINMSKESSQLFIEKWESEIKEENNTIENITPSITTSAIAEEIESEQSEQAAENIALENISEVPEQISEQIEGNITENESLVIETQNMSELNPKINFNINLDFSKYKRYVIGAVIIILIMLMFITGVWKKIIEFFEEEVDEEPKNGKIAKNSRKKR
jgi:uncharacterized membrane protein